MNEDSKSSDAESDHLVRPSTLSRPGFLQKWSRHQRNNKYILEEGCQDKNLLDNYDLNSLWTCDPSFVMLTEKDSPNVFCRRLYDWTYFDATLTFVGPDEDPLEFPETKYIVIQKGTRLHLKYTPDSLFLLGWATPPRKFKSSYPRAVTFVAKDQRPLRDRTPTKSKASQEPRKTSVTDAMRLIDLGDVDWCRTYRARIDEPNLENATMRWFKEMVLKETGPDEINDRMGPLPKGCLVGVRDLQLKWVRRETGGSATSTDPYRSASNRYDQLLQDAELARQRRQKLLADKRKAEAKEKRKSLKQGGNFKDVPTDKHQLGTEVSASLDAKGEKPPLVPPSEEEDAQVTSKGRRDNPSQKRQLRKNMTPDELAAFDAEAKERMRERKRRYRESQKLKKAHGDQSKSHFLDEGRQDEMEMGSGPDPKRGKTSRSHGSSHEESEDYPSSTGPAPATLTLAQTTAMAPRDQFLGTVHQSSVPPAWVHTYFTPIFNTIATGMSQFNIAPLANVMQEISDTNKTLLSEMSQQIKQSNETMASRLASQQRLMEEQGKMLKKMKKEKAFTIEQFIDFSQKLQATQVPGLGPRPYLGTEPAGVQTGSVAPPTVPFRKPVDLPESSAPMASTVQKPPDKHTKGRSSTKSAEESAGDDSSSDEDDFSSSEETDDVLNDSVPLKLSKADTSKGRKKKDKSKRSKRSKASK